MITTVQIAPANRARLRELIAEWEAEADRRDRMFTEDTYTHRKWLASRDRQLTTACMIVGVLQGLGLDQ